MKKGILKSKEREGKSDGSSKQSSFQHSPIYCNAHISAANSKSLRDVLPVRLVGLCNFRSKCVHFVTIENVEMSSISKPARELGERLQRERESRRMSLERVGIELHIPIHHLEAIEEGNFSAFSAEIYARGACLKYAEFLGMGGDEAERAIWRALSVGRQRVPLKIHTAFSWIERLWNARLMVWVMVGVVVVMIGGYIGWQIRSFWQLPPVNLLTEIPPVQDDSTLLVRGSTEPEVRVKLNDEPVILHSDATFEVSLKLHPGINVIRIEAQNAAGRTAIIERQVLRPRG